MAATDSPSWAPLLYWLRDQVRPLLPGGVASAGPLAALAGPFVVPAGSVWTSIGNVHDVTRYLRYHGAQQPPALQPPSAASLSLLLATSDVALTP